MQAEKRIEELEARVEELNDFIENASIPLHWVNGDGTIIWANQAELDALGYSKEEYIGQPIANFHADENTINDILTRLKNKETLINYESKLKRKDGKLISVLINSNVLFKDGKFVHTRCFTRDITELKIQQKKQEELVNELKEANAELREFSYVVSHDLKSPVRAVSHLADIILLDNGEKIDESGREHLQMIKVRARRMLQMINTILTYSRIGDVAFKPEIFSTRDMVNEVIAELEIPAHIKVELETEMPVIKSFRLPLHQVFLNLVENAVRFNDKDLGIVKIGCYNMEDKWEFFVKDNGPGIAPEHQEKVFGIFQTLNAKDVVDSTGIGLPIVKKIIRNYQGDICIDSVPGEYTNFYFTLPKETA